MWNGGSEAEKGKKCRIKFINEKEGGEYDDFRENAAAASEQFSDSHDV